MADFLVRIDHAKGSTFLQWSTSVDAFTAKFSDEAEIARVAESDGWLGDLEARMARVRAKGTSSLRHRSAQHTVTYNTVGADGTCMTWAQIQEWCADGLPGFEDGVGLPVGRCRCNVEDPDGERPKCGEPDAV